MKIKYSKFFLFFFLYRCLYSILAETVVANFVKLGDSSRYQTASFPTDITFLIQDTKLTEAIGALLSFVGALLSFGIFQKAILTNILFQAIGFVGLWTFIKSLSLKERKLAMPILLTPSFNLWSSVASKESIVILGIGLVCAYISDLYKGKRKLQWYELLGFYIIGIYKPQFLISIAILIVMLKFTSLFIAKDKLWIAIIFPLLSLMPLYIYREKIVELSFQIESHFDAGQSSRAAFWIEDYDVFSKAFEGMYLSFIGPTLDEVLLRASPVFILVFLESFFLLLYLLILLIIKKPLKIGLEKYTIAISSLLWLMFTAYPTGVINPGSAIRYRTNYLLLIVFIFIVVIKNHSKFKDSYKVIGYNQQKHKVFNK